MNRDDALRIDRLCELYLEAMETQNDAALTILWEQAGQDDALLQAFRDLNAGLVEETLEVEQTQTDQAVAQLVEQHLPGATRIVPPGSITVSAIMLEMSKQSQYLNQSDLASLVAKLAACDEVLPELQGLTALQQWAEGKFGPAPRGFWQAFHHARLDIGMRQEATPHYALAARTAPKDKG